MTKEDENKIEKLEEVQEQEDNQITELFDDDLDNVVGGTKIGERDNNSQYNPERDINNTPIPKGHSTSNVPDNIKTITPRTYMT